MTESPTPSNFAKWLRILASGLLSGAVAAFIWNGQSFLAYGFEEPLEFYAAITGIFGGLIGVFIAWFLIGAGIAFFVKKNSPALGWWFLLYVVFTIMGIAS